MEKNIASVKEKNCLSCLFHTRCPLAYYGSEQPVFCPKQKVTEVDPWVIGKDRNLQRLSEYWPN
jgi:hypothetical protein